MTHHPIDPAQLSAIQARADKANDLDDPWDMQRPSLEQVADFIRHAREDIPYLLAALAHLQAENTELRDWKDSALTFFKQWHELGDTLMELTPLTIGDNIPRRLRELIPQRIQELEAARDEAQRALASLQMDLEEGSERG